jgi:hypothetical protein
MEYLFDIFLIAICAALINNFVFSILSAFVHLSVYRARWIWQWAWEVLSRL